MVEHMDGRWKSLKGAPGRRIRKGFIPKVSMLLAGYGAVSSTWRSATRLTWSTAADMRSAKGTPDKLDDELGLDGPYKSRLNLSRSPVRYLLGQLRFRFLFVFLAFLLGLQSHLHP